MSADQPPPLAQTTFAGRIARTIAHHGPISLLQFMGEANAHYYDQHDPLGTAGDFTTAPEISQMFGELVGLWLADMWRRAGAPTPVRYVELGPGRGTLARDALRVMARQGLTPAVHFVEASRALTAVQRDAVPGATWHTDLTGVPEDAPLLVVANEFLDALPIRQLVRTKAGWRERMVGLVDGRLAPVAGTLPMDAAVPAEHAAPEGTIQETCPGAAAIVGELARRLAAQGGAALIIDYGHAAPHTGSTLQALRAHRRADPFAEAGEADLTAHVDFAAIVATAQAQGARWLGTSEQGAWLHALGIEARAAALATAAPEHAGAVKAALERLTAPEQMGGLFKVCGLAAPEWPDGAGFTMAKPDRLGCP